MIKKLRDSEESQVIQYGDIYYSDAYGKLYEDIENGEYGRIEFVSKLGLVVHPYIKRPIHWLINGKQYYDIVTSYGYGGPLITELNVESDDCRHDLMTEFMEWFSTYCRMNDIICEFIRFHTLYGNAIYCGGFYDVIYNRNTIAIDLTDADFFFTQFDPKCRNMIRKAEKLGVEIEIDDALASIDTFVDIYYATMKKDSAKDYYFFSKKYFHRIRDELAGSSLLVNAIYNKETIASSLFLYNLGGFAHYHLSATRPEFYKLAANNLILKNACDALRNRSCTWLHLGGGLSSGLPDKLFAFKKSFGRLNSNEKEFFIGKKIWNKVVYDKVCSVYIDEGGRVNSFFPMYREK